MTHERCETCRFWCGIVSGRIHTPGPCHRYPPTVFYNHTVPMAQNQRPILSYNDWCGEWQETSRPHRRA